MKEEVDLQNTKDSLSFANTKNAIKENIQSGK